MSDRIRRRKPKSETPATGSRLAFVNAAMGELGKSYESHRDCSGFTAWAARQAGFTLPEGSEAQQQVGKTVARASWQPGDLCFWATSTGHVAMYIGDDKVIHAINPSQGIIISDVDAQMGGAFEECRAVLPPSAVADPPKGEGVTADAVIGDPSGSIPNDLQIAYGRGGPWAKVNQDDAFFLKYGAKHGVPPEMLKAMQVIESGGEMLWNQGGSGAYGTMQIKEAYWGSEAKKLGYDLKTREGQVAMAAAILGGAVSWVKGKTPRERFLSTYYPTAGLDVPGEDGHTPRQYLADMDRLVGIIQVAGGHQTPATSTTPRPKPTLDPWRPYPYPPMVDVLVSKPGDGAGFDRVKFRGDRIVGTCNHITDGHGSIEWYRDFFSTGGQRAWDALTDTVIGRDGRIGLLNDWRNKDRGGTRAGWANGTATGIEGDGVAFYRKFPLINDVLVSIEHEAVSGEALTKAQFDSSVELSTANAQAVKCPWDTYPYHPGLGGINIEQMHFLFAPKACPAEPFISTHYPQKIAAVKAKLKAWQGGQQSAPIPVPDPVWYTRFGFSLQEIETFWGNMVRHNPDGTTDDLSFNENGALSLFWLNRCDRDGQFPEAERIWYADAQFVEGSEVYASWEGGWTAYLALADSRASWRWLDDEK